ncbi:MAG: hypothetical protein AVDCRST_MAG60-640, partial [uncultured Nocardioides sp.]
CGWGENWTATASATTARALGARQVHDASTRQRLAGGR